MTNDQFELLMEMLNNLLVEAKQSREELRQLKAAMFASAPAPNLLYDLDKLRGFDFGSIGAIALERDEDGPTILQWCGRRYMRRAITNKFGKAIWFSRKLEGENAGYETLIKFRRDVAAEAVPSQLKDYTRQVAPQRRNGRQPARATSRD